MCEIKRTNGIKKKKKITFRIGSAHSSTVIILHEAQFYNQNLNSNYNESDLIETDIGIYFYILF